MEEKKIDYESAGKQFVKNCLGEQKEKSGLFLWEHANYAADYLFEIIKKHEEIDGNTCAVLYFAALGHDLLKDSETTEEDIRTQWGDEALTYIKALTKEDGDDKPFMEYIDKLKNTSEETLLVKFADIYANVFNSVTRYNDLDPVWVRTFWLPLLEKYRRELFGRTFVKYPRSAEQMIEDIELAIERLLGKMGLFRQFQYLHDFLKWFPVYLSTNLKRYETQGASFQYKGCIVERIDSPGREEGLWQKALSDGESYTARVFILMELGGEECEIPYFNLPLVTPRGTFIIEGQERIPLKTFKLVEDFSPEFNESEFTPSGPSSQQYSPVALCEAIKGDLQDISLGNPQADPIGWLNRLIQMSNLVNLFKNKKGKREYTKDVQRLIKGTNRYRNELKLPPRIFDKIKMLNRAILEWHYPKITPKSKKIYNLTEAERLRDLSGFVLHEENFYSYLKKTLERELERHNKSNDILSYLSNPEIVGGFDRFIRLFHTTWANHKFPFLDATSPLAELEHMRRIAFTRGEIAKIGRNIHLSHYGRVCVVETPESEKIGLRLHLAHKAKVSEDGEILTPVVHIKDNTIQCLPSDDGEPPPIADGYSQLDEKEILVRGGEDVYRCASDKIEYRDESPDQLFGYAALQVPFIGHNDPARALMGAKNLKQAVPLENPEVPLVQTGYEDVAAELTGGIIRAHKPGIVKKADHDKIIVETDKDGTATYHLICNVPSVMSKVAVLQRPVVKEGETISKGRIIAERAGTHDGKLALGANFLVAYMPYYGYNMDDGIVVSQSVVDRLKSIHIETHEYDVDTRALPESFAPVGSEVKHDTVVAVFTQPRDSADFIESEFRGSKTPEKLCGKIEQDIEFIDAKGEKDHIEWLNELLSIPNFYDQLVQYGYDKLKKVPKPLKGLLDKTQVYRARKPYNELNPFEQKDIKNLNRVLIERLYQEETPIQEAKVKIEIRAKGDLIGGKLVRISLKGRALKIWVQKERPLEVGDKLMGRHGNKGVVSRIVQDEEMPYFEIRGQRKHIEMILNPHGVISRMNLGQILETHFGWIAKEHPDESIRNTASLMGKPFTAIDFSQLSEWLKEGGLDNSGTAVLSKQGKLLTNKPVLVGYQYIVKLNHLASSKFSVRGEKGPVSYVTGMPLSGKKAGGGQRIGEMEVWALLAHGATGIVNLMLGKRANAKSTEKTGAMALSESLKAFVYYWRGLGVSIEFIDKEDKVVEPENFDSTKRNLVSSYRIHLPEGPQILKWGYHVSIPKKGLKEGVVAFRERKVTQIEAVKGAKQILTLNELRREYKDEMGYINLRNPVMLLERSLSYLPVVPYRCRPHSKSKLTRLYESILLKEVEIRKKDSGYEGYGQLLREQQKLVSALEKELLHFVSGKKGILRRAILGKRVSFSARAVIIPDPDLKPFEIGVPRDVMVVFGLKDGDKVLANRQPTLHTHNIQVFNVVENDSATISLNPLVCGGFNADFDGDTMALYKVEKGVDVPDIMSSSNQILLNASGKLNISLSQDIVAGLYLLSSSEQGRKEIADEIGDMELYTADQEEIDKKKTENIVFRHFLKHGDHVKTFEFAHKIAKLGLKAATESGLTLSGFDLNGLALTDEAKQNCLKSKDPEGDAEKLLETNVQGKKDHPLRVMIASGARGDYKNLCQMVGFRGHVEKMGGVKSTGIIPASYLEGLTPTEYYLACYGARKTLGDKKLVTPDCGYLTRRLVYAVADMTIGEGDCGTKNSVMMNTDYVLGRVMVDSCGQEVLIGDYEYVSLKEKNVESVYVRSPLTCESEKGICRKCYGWELGRRKEPPLGFAVGILAAEVIGERATQDAMRSYHKGEATKTITKFDMARAVFDNTPAPDEPDEGKRVSEVVQNIEDLIGKIRFLHEQVYEKKVDIKHYEVIMRGLMKDSKFIGTKDIIKEKTVLHRASFSQTRDIIYNSAAQEHNDIFSVPFERLFF